MSKNKKGDDLFGDMPVTPEFDAFPSEVIASLTGKSPAVKQPASDASAKDEAKPRPEQKAEPKPKPLAKPEAPTPPKPGAGAKAEAKPEPQPEAKPQPKAKPEPQPEPKAQAKTAPAPRPKTEPAPEAKTQAAPEPRPRAEAGPEPKAPAEPAPELPRKTPEQTAQPARDAATAKTPGTNRGATPQAARPRSAADTSPDDASAATPGEATPSSPLEAMLLSRPSPVALAAIAGVFLAGLVLGLWAFMPWEGLWARAMEAVDARLPGAALSWDAVENAGPGGATFRGLEADLRGRRVALDNAALSLGLARPLTLTLGTGGRTLVVGTGYTGHVTLDGALDLGAALPDQDSEGVVEITAAMDPDGRGALPAKADLTLACERGRLAGTPLEGLLLRLKVSEETLTLTQCTMKRPLALTLSGTASLQRDNLGQSAYSLGGTFTVGGNSSPYAKSGVLADLSGLLTGDFSALTR